LSNSTSQPESSQPTAVPFATPEPASSVDLQTVYAPIRNELAQVEDILREELSSETPFVDQLLEHSWLLGGKRMRPAFVLLSAGYFGAVKRPALQMAAALEMVHTATLVHDDILDEADTRRHEPTANSKWGNKVGVLLGDYLFTHSFHVASLSQSVEAVRLLAASSNRVCEGEMRQNAWRGNFELSEADYFQMVSDKTAELTACACHVGALLSGASEKQAEEFRNYGLHLGIAFQIIDDLLDVAGHADTVGKTLGTDLLNQKPTLPVIHCLATLPDAEQAELLKVLGSGQATPDVVIPALKSTASIEYSRKVAADFATRSINFANSLENNEFSDSLLSIAQFVLDRTR
jgi:octaprenyl-diphosphate synthase